MQTIYARPVSIRELSAPPIRRYVLDVLLAPLPNTPRQHLQWAALSRLLDGTFKPYWLISGDGKRAGVFILQKRGNRAVIAGLAYPENAPHWDWDAVVAHAEDAAQALGCADGLSFDCEGGSAVQQGIAAAALRAGAKGQFMLGGAAHGS